MPAGRRNKYDEYVKPHLELIQKWAAGGMLEKEMCQKLGVGTSAWAEYKNDFAELADALKKGRTSLVGEYISALKKRATGFHEEEKKIYRKRDTETNTMTEYTEVTTKYFPPDAATLIFALKNYAKDEFSNDPQGFDLRREELELRKKLADEKLWNGLSEGVGD